MVLRPATPLSVLFFAAFALLLISALSTPVIKAIPLASFNGYTFGVWGYCKGSDCSAIKIGYDMQSLAGITNSDFSLPESTRNSLSPILVIHPVAAFLSLICTILAIAAHFHSPAHSPRFLLGLFILSIPTLLVSLLAFLVDILLFLPHVSWGGWVVVAATAIIGVSGLVTCGMRRSLVSRKARRKRIQENAEMNGQNYYNNFGAKQASEPAVATSVVESLPRAESPPPLTGGSTVPLNSAQSVPFGAYDAKAVPSDDRIPLNTAVAPPAMAGGQAYGGPMRPRNGSVNQQSEEYGNTVMAMGRPSLESNRSNSSFNGRGGRGGYPTSRGGYPPRGGPMMRGGPPGMRGSYRGRSGPMIGRVPPPPGYGPQDRYNPSPYEMGPSSRGISPAVARPQEIAIGQAVEMDANIGVPSPARSPVETTPPDEYIPVRSQWIQRQPAPNINTNVTGNRALSPIQASPNSVSKYSQSQALGHARTASGSYYEDVDPQFAEVPPAASTVPPPMLTASSAAIPPVLMTGGATELQRGPPLSNTNYQPSEAVPPLPLDTLRQESQESLQEGQRSPATSDTSHFTSVSQRGINPAWRPGMPPSGRGPPPPRPSDMLLNSNPDFSLPGMGPTGRGRGGFRGRGGGGMGPGRRSPAMGMSMGGGLGQPSRYPMP
ncbi:uncharacterized protein PV09_08810 [Verruconis gallopava]|uniref:PH-response regulator protein palI/RIM9 n=1 Tax=Verruconis gallopava TaxID=253628 RepID=A0A0D1XBE5_9PEZI|nr:uncharacterized protein PV09_08810 [Verruconis gallopava]KIV99505.1 hypothetical protein PV09_08810 [Verruconis gallopava]